MPRLRCFRSTLARLALSAMTGIGVLSMPVSALSHEEWVSAFVRFVEWPVPLSGIDGPLVVCQRPGSPGLALEGKKVRGLTLKVSRISLPMQLAGCHIYVELAVDEVNSMPWLKAVNDLNTAAPQTVPPSVRAFPFVLAVGLGDRFCGLGGAICVVTDAVSAVENYRLNLDTLSRAGFRVDTQLLRSQSSRSAKAE